MKNLTKEKELSLQSKFFRMSFHIFWMIFVSWIPKHGLSSWKRCVLNFWGGQFLKIQLSIPLAIFMTRGTSLWSGEVRLAPKQRFIILIM